MCSWAHDGSSRVDGHVYMGWGDGWTCSQKANPLKHIAYKDNISHSRSLRHTLLEAGRLLLTSVTIWLSCYQTLSLASASGHCHRQDTDLSHAKQSLRSVPKLTQPWSLNSGLGVLAGAENRCLVINRHRCRKGQEPGERRTGTLDVRRPKTDLGKGWYVRLWTSSESGIDWNIQDSPSLIRYHQTIRKPCSKNVHYFPSVVPDTNTQPSTDMQDLK